MIIFVRAANVTLILKKYLTLDGYFKPILLMVVIQIKIDATTLMMNLQILISIVKKDFKNRQVRFLNFFMNLQQKKMFKK